MSNAYYLWPCITHGYDRGRKKSRLPRRNIGESAIKKVTENSIYRQLKTRSPAYISARTILYIMRKAAGSYCERERNGILFADAVDGYGDGIAIARGEHHLAESIKPGDVGILFDNAVAVGYFYVCYDVVAL